MTDPLPPGSTIGILGGGQLGRMTALAAAELGYDVHIFSPEANGPAARVAAVETVADYGDRDALAAFARAVDVVTFEFENVPHESVQFLATDRLVRPGWRVLRTAQDRGEEKDFFQEIGVPTAPFAKVTSRTDLESGCDLVGRPAVLKTARLGYDGKGQARILADTKLEDAWAGIGAVPAIIEAFVDFSSEISVLVARGLSGDVAAYDPAENVHEHHILRRSTVPANIPQDLANRAREIAVRIAEKLDLTGLVAVEMFVTRDGALIVNEIAPRPHNSGHWTMDACRNSQFHQFVRAVAGLPLGSTERHSDAEMLNLIGAEVEDWPRLLADPSACLHLYGKRESRPGRKMGHVTRLRPRAQR